MPTRPKGSAPVAGIASFIAQNFKFILIFGVPILVAGSLIGKDQTLSGKIDNILLVLFVCWASYGFWILMRPDHTQRRFMIILFSFTLLLILILKILTINRESYSLQIIDHILFSLYAGGFAVSTVYTINRLLRFIIQNIKSFDVDIILFSLLGPGFIYFSFLIYKIYNHKFYIFDYQIPNFPAYVLYILIYLLGSVGFSSLFVRNLPRKQWLIFVALATSTIYSLYSFLISAHIPNNYIEIISFLIFLPYLSGAFVFGFMFEGQHSHEYGQFFQKFSPTDQRASNTTTPNQNTPRQQFYDPSAFERRRAPKHDAPLDSNENISHGNPDGRHPDDTALYAIVDDPNATIEARKAAFDEIIERQQERKRRAHRPDDQ